MENYRLCGLDKLDFKCGSRGCGWIRIEYAKDSYKNCFRLQNLPNQTAFKAFLHGIGG